MEQERIFRPRYKRANFGDQFAVLQNEQLRVCWFKRLSGWGFAEFYTPDGKLMGVLDHLGEVKIRDCDIPMRLEAESYRMEQTADSVDLVFEVQSMVPSRYLEGSSFENWVCIPFTRPCLTGTVRVSLDRTRPILHYSMQVKSGGNFYVQYIRGPWLLVGEASFGDQKTDAVFPGVEWLQDREWSSGSDWFRYPWSEKYAPHPNKVTVPCMSVSHEGWAISVSWDPNQWTTRWFNYPEYDPQPVFAVPNFVERLPNSLLGLMAPCATGEKDENQLYADPPLEMHLDQPVRMEADIFLTRGNAAEAVTDFVKRKGLPALREASDAATLRQKLNEIMHHFNTNLWNAEKGFSFPQPHTYFNFDVPDVIRDFVRLYPDNPDTPGLLEKIAFCEQKKPLPTDAEKRRSLLESGENLLKQQKPDGSFRFEQGMSGRIKDDFSVASLLCAPMGLDQDTALAINMRPAYQLFKIASQIGACEEAVRFRNAARRAADYCLDMTRPEGGDYWETPLHAPNLLAAGYGAVSYYMAYEAFQKPVYREKAIYWIRALLPFTNLWEPKNANVLYDTKPCFCSSDWYFANWVRDHVQWEILRIFTLSAECGIDWAKIDPEIDWTQYQTGITVAAARWICDHKKGNWMPHNLPETYALYCEGAFDGCYADTHNSVSDHFGGMFIRPDPIAQNLLDLICKQ